MLDKMEKIVSLCKRRGFIFHGSEIYGGMANSWDYGPLGVELKNNIKQAWWKRFVQQRSDLVGIDAALIMNPKVWEASGHLSAGFADPLIECKKCHERYRADKIAVAKPCAKCGSKGSFTKPQMFNLMFKTFIGPAEESANAAYFRPETAQAMFVDFKQILETTRRRLPFGIAQIGKAFRNEITPGNFIFRTREFEQMEIEYFIEEEDWKKDFEYWLKEMYEWMKDLGLNKKHLHDLEVPDGERAHYSKRTIDIEYDFPFGKDELYGLAYRGDFDLKNHFKEAPYRDLETNETSWPHVIEPTFGVDRTVLAVLAEHYNEEEAPTSEKGETDKRVVMKFPKWLAPVKIAVLPLSKKENLQTVARKVYDDLRLKFVCEYDETQSIGKRYRRQDEIGTPYCVTVDFDTLEKDDSVTVRDRDTMAQERVKISDLEKYFTENLNIIRI